MIISLSTTNTRPKLRWRGTRFFASTRVHLLGDKDLRQKTAPSTCRAGVEEENDIAKQLASALGLPLDMPMDVTVDLGPMAPTGGPSAVSWCDEGRFPEFKVFVKYENEDGGLGRLMGEDEAQALLKRGPLMVCTVIGFPAEVIPHQDIIHAAHFAEAADVGEVAQFLTENEVRRRLCVGSPVAFRAGRYRFPAFWKRDQIVRLPLIVGITSPIPNE
jgi:hypothetical protein